MEYHGERRWAEITSTYMNAYDLRVLCNLEVVKSLGDDRLVGIQTTIEIYNYVTNGIHNFVR